MYFATDLLLCGDFQNEVLQGAARISELPQMEDSAYPYNAEEQSLRGRIRTEDRVSVIIASVSGSQPFSALRQNHMHRN